MSNGDAGQDDTKPGAVNPSLVFRHVWGQLLELKRRERGYEGLVAKDESSVYEAC